MNEPFRSPLLISGSMVVVHILFCLFPFVSKSFENGLATGITVCLMVLVGLLWAWVGVFLWGRIKPVPFDKTML
jgi:hypothetical protein